MRRIRRIFLSLLLLCVTLLAGGYVYLSTGLATSRVAARLQAAYGARVGLENADIGLGGSKLRDLQLFEDGPDAPPEPWASANDVDAALTLWDVISGDTVPDDVTLNGAAVLLRFDRDGKLLTRLPPRKTPAEKVGTIHLRGGQVTIRQEGHPDLLVTNIDADLKPDGDHFELKGTADRAPWGKWDVRASWDRSTNAAELNMKTSGDAVTFTKEQLADLPFVSASVWKHVKIDGKAKVDLTLSMSDKAHNRTVLDITDADLFIPSIDLKTDKTGGHVVVEDRVVTLTGVYGRSAEGDIKTDGTLDFHRAIDVLKFKILVKSVQFKGLPVGWLNGSADADKLKGSVSAKADLEVEIRNGNAQTRVHGDLTLDSLALTFPFTLEKPGKGFSLKRPKFGGFSWLTAEPDNVWRASVSLPETDLQKLLRGLGIADGSVTGRIAGDAEIVVPEDQLSNPRSYRLHGSLRASWLCVCGVEVRDVVAHLDYRDGILEIDKICGRMPQRGPPGCGPPEDGTFNADAHLELFPARQLTAHLRSTHLPLAQLLTPLLANLPIGGTLSGSATLTAPLHHIGEVTAWRGTGELTCDAVGVGDWLGRNAAADVGLCGGRLTVAGLRAQVEDAEVCGGGDIVLAAPYHYSAGLEVRDAGAALLKKLAARDLRCRWSATANLRGDVRPFTLAADGTVVADVRIGPAHLDDLAFRWQRDGDQLSLTDIHARLYHGELIGSARLPLVSSAPGGIDLRYDRVDLSALSEECPVSPWLLQGAASGTVTGDLSCAPAKLEVTTRISRGRVGGVPVEQLNGSLTYRGDGADYRLDGRLLGGQLHLDGRLPSTMDRPEGRLRIFGAAVARLREVAGLRAALGELRGEADLDVAYHEENGTPAAEGQLIVNRLRWGDAELSESIQADVLVKDGAVRLRNLNGDLARGLLYGQASYALEPSGRGSLELAVDGADAARLLAGWPAAERVEGNVDLRLRGQLGAEWRGGGTLTLNRGSIAGVEVSDWRLPFNGSYLPAEGRGQIEVHETGGQVARGRATGRVSLTWGVSPRVDGQLRFYGVEMRSLLRSSADANAIGAGQLSGRLDFSGENLRSKDDLTATLEASLQQAQMLEMPILRQLVPYIAPGQSAAVFQAGDVRARLANGIVRVERLRLVSTLVQLIAEGTVALSGQLNIEVTANAGRLVDDLPTLRGLGGRVPAVGALSLALLTEASNFLANRLVHLHVGGTVSSPVIHVEPIALLPEEVVRFFLSWAGGGAKAVGGVIP